MPCCDQLTSSEHNGQPIKNETTNNYVLMMHSCQTNEFEYIYASIAEYQFTGNMKNRKPVNDTTIQDIVQNQ